MEILGYIAALFMGVIMGLVGGGGSILTVPILVYFFKVDAVSATTGSLFVVGFGAMIGAVIHLKQGYVDFKTGFQFALPGLFGVILGRKFLLPMLPDQLLFFDEISISKSTFILIIFSITMIAASFSLLRPKVSNIHLQPHLIKLVFQGFFVGSVTGFVGAGGGFLIVPALIIFGKLPLKVAVGTSLVIMSFNSLFGFALSLQSELINWALILKVTILGILGLLIGILTSKKIDENHLKKGFGFMILAIGGFILIQQTLK